jgi:hypothetical protein
MMNHLSTKRESGMPSYDPVQLDGYELYPTIRQDIEKFLKIRHTHKDIDHAVFSLLCTISTVIQNVTSEEEDKFLTQKISKVINVWLQISKVS